MTLVVLDPGHGGTAKIGDSSPNNAVGPTGLLEKTVTLDLAFRAEKILADLGHSVVLTRKADNNVGLADRAKAAKSIAAPVFLSIHLNGFDHVVQGTETICNTVHNSLSADLCRAVQKRVVAATGHNDRNAGHPGGVKRQPLGVLKPGLHHASTACCLLEVSFMDVAAEETRLKTTAYLDKIAKAIAAGITDFIGVGELAAVRGAGVFEDGFAAAGGKASPLPPATKAASRAPSGKPIAKPSRKTSAKMNDKKEFSKVDIGAGFDPGSPVRGSTAAAPASTAFDMQAFRSFVQSLGLRHFSAEELLFMGASNAPGGSCAGRNHLPEQAKWHRIAATARMLDEIRHRLNAKCTVLSGYRSPAYNSCIGGESASLHMEFNAIDFRCVSGTAAQWHAVAKAVRASTPDFKGGIGKYSSFVHIDTRGTNANW